MKAQDIDVGDEQASALEGAAWTLPQWSIADLDNSRVSGQAENTSPAGTTNHARKTCAIVI
jgi:hypothetical protein